VNYTVLIKVSAALIVIIAALLLWSYLMDHLSEGLFKDFALGLTLLIGAAAITFVLIIVNS